MAVGSAEYQVGVKLTGDATDLKSEITSATTAIGTLDTTVSQTSDSIVNTSGRKLKSAGKTIGTDFAQSLTSGIASGDVVGSVSGIFSSLAMVGGFAALGVGLGGALLTGIIKGASAERQKMIDSFNSAFEALELKASQTGKEIAAEILSGFEASKAIEDIGGGDADLGFDRATEAAAKLNIEAGELVELVRSGITPATQETYDVLKKQLDAANDLTVLDEAHNEELAKEKALLEPIYSLVFKRTNEVEKLQKVGELEVQTLKEQVVQQELLAIQAAGTAQHTREYAAALERADAAARLLAGRRLPSSDSMNGL
jgi:hypothetical protein